MWSIVIAESMARRRVAASKMRRWLLAAASLICCLAAKAGASPYAPVYALGVGDMLWESALGWEQTRFDTRSLGFNAGGHSRFLLGRQGLSWGLTDQWSLKAIGTYAEPQARNPINPTERKSGLRSPEVSLQWLSDAKRGVRPWARLEIHINPNNNSATNRVGAHAGALLNTARGSHLALSLESSYFDTPGVRLDAVHGKLGQSLGRWMLTAGLTHADMEGYRTDIATVGTTQFQSIDAGLSMRTGERMWVGVDLRRQVATARSLNGPSQRRFDNRATDQVVMLSARWLFSAHQAPSAERAGASHTPRAASGAPAQSLSFQSSGGSILGGPARFCATICATR